MSKRSMITLHIQRAEDVLLKTPILSPGNRQLHPTVEEFLIDEAENLPSATEVMIFARIEESNAVSEKEVADAIHGHFAYKSLKARTSVGKIIRLGWRSLVVSFGFLMFMFLIAFAITSLFTENTIMMTFRELFIILGWVALWRPADLLLYDWRVVKRKESLYKRLANCKVVFSSNELMDMPVKP